MKKIIFLMLIIAGFVSCDGKWTDTYYFQNESGYDVIIEGYRSHNTPDRIKLPDNDIYMCITNSYPGQESYPFQYYNKVRIVFNNERALTYYYDHDGVYNLINYIREKINKHDSNYYYTFTPEMYNEAVPIEEVER